MPRGSTPHPTGNRRVRPAIGPIALPVTVAYGQGGFALASALWQAYVTGVLDRGAPSVKDDDVGAHDADASPFHRLVPFGLYDGQRRVVQYLRLSVTDRCSFRCVYCMPEAGLTFAPRAEVMSFEEMARLVRVFARLGVTRVRLTGGEPLLRRDLPDLVRQIAAVDGIDDLALSTNGLALAELAGPLAEAGLRRVNVSLDSLDAHTFARLTRTRTETLDKVIAGIDAALAAGLAPVKINTVVIRGHNDHELPAIVRWAAARGVEPRFIEYMPIGVDDRWGPASFVPVAEMRERLAAFELLPEPTAAHGGGPARYRRYAVDGRALDIGFITAVSEHFCDTCNRVRVTAKGVLQECLAFPGDLSLRDRMRAGEDDEALTGTIRQALFAKGPGHRFQVGQRTFQSMSITGG